MTMFVFLVVVAAVGAFLVFCMHVGEQEEIFTAKPPEWDPPRPNVPPMVDGPAVKCRCIDCGCFYVGCEKIYYFDHNELRGKCDVTPYKGLCLQCWITVEEGLDPYDEKKCMYYWPKKNARNKV